MNENIVSVNNLSVSFDYQENFLSKKQKIKAVNNINIKIKKGSFFGLVGESGSGKTQTFFSITGILSELDILENTIEYSKSDLISVKNLGLKADESNIIANEWIYNISNRFRNFFTFICPPTMCKNFFRRVQICSHQECRPINCMKS